MGSKKDGKSKKEGKPEYKQSEKVKKSEAKKRESKHEKRKSRKGRRKHSGSSSSSSAASYGSRRRRRHERIKKLTQILEQRTDLHEVKVPESKDPEKPIETIQFLRRHTEYEEDIEPAYVEHLDLTRASFIQDGTEIMTVQIIGQNFLQVLKPVITFGRILARYPISHKVSPEGFIIFQLNYLNPFALTFLISNIFCTTIFAMGVIVAFCLWMNVPLGVDFFYGDQFANYYLTKYKLDIGGIRNDQGKKVELWLRNRPERYLFDRHVAIFISVWAYLLHSIISGWKIQFQGQRLVEYYNFWMRSMYTMKMDVTKGVSNRVYFLCGAYVAFIICYILLSLLHVLPTMSGLPAVMTAILIRPFYGHLMDINYNDPTQCLDTPPCFPKVFNIGREISAILLSYLTSVGTFYALWFVMICKCLKNGFAIWNGRLYSILLASKDARQSRSGRTTYTLLFKDHCTLLDLMEATDRIFSGIIESYFGLQALSYCFEIHFILRTGRSGYNDLQAKKGDFFTRPHDWIAGVIILAIHTVYILVTLKGAAEVGEEALTGLEIIRRRSLLGRKSDSELYFLMSLFSSYTAHKPIVPAAYGFFGCNRQFMLGILGTVLTYFTIVYQFDPKFDFQRELQDTPREFIQQFICLAEKSRFGFLSGRPECKFDVYSKR